MKRYFLNFLILMFALYQGYGQELDFAVRIKLKSQAAHLGIPREYEFRDKIIMDVYGFEVPTRITDELGYVHERYAQYYKGIRVEHSDIRTHYFDGKLVAINGTYADVPDIDVSVVLSKEAAVRKAIDHIGEKKYFREDERECDAIIFRRAALIGGICDAAPNFKQFLFAYLTHKYYFCVFNILSL